MAISNDAATVESGKDGKGRARLSAVVRSLKHRNYQLFFSGQLISLVGTWMQSVAEAWLVYRLTGSAVALGSVGFASQIPVFLLAPIGGIVADRVNRHRILIATQAVSMLLASVLATLTLTGAIQIWHVYLLAGLLGVVNAFDIPARQAFVVDMVGKEDLVNAIALNSSMFNGARIIGPAVAGILVAQIGEGWCFFGNAVSYIAVIGGLLMMKLAKRERLRPAGSALERIKEGFAFAWRMLPIRSLLMLIGLISLVGMPYAVLMPIIADKVLGGGAQGLGILMGASGIGALFAALTLASRTGLKGLGQWVAFSAIGFGASLLLFSFSRSFWLSAALLLPVGFCMMLQMSSSNTLVQSMVPDELRGRVMSVYSMMFMGMAPLGSLFAGGVSEVIGPTSTVAVGGAVCIVGSLFFWLRLPALRVEARRLILALQMTGGTPSEATGVGSGEIAARRLSQR